MTKLKLRFFQLPALALLSLLLLAGKSESLPSKKAAPTVLATEAGVDAPGNDGLALFGKLALEEKGLDFKVFFRAYAGYMRLAASGLIVKPILAIADMSQPSGNKRLYIIDMAQGSLLRHTLVAHGQGSGNIVATQFSNAAQSHQSSLGFYITDQTYQGGNGLSLRLRGMEKGFNDNAMSRAIVMHGADYVNQSAASAGRIGRSWGCPAVSVAEHKDIIGLLKQGSCLFIYGQDQRYLSQSSLGNSAAISGELN